MPVPFQPTLNAVLNAIAATLLLIGWFQIRKGNREGHRRFMVGALIVTSLFLISYVIYHQRVGSVPYPYADWTRFVYYTILVPHVILAAVQVPFILLAVWRAIRGEFDLHKRITRWIWPVWMFVSVTGVMIYLMLYRPF